MLQNITWHIPQNQKVGSQLDTPDGTHPTQLDTPYRSNPTQLDLIPYHFDETNHWQKIPGTNQLIWTHPTLVYTPDGPHPTQLDRADNIHSTQLEIPDGTRTTQLGTEVSSKFLTHRIVLIIPSELLLSELASDYSH